MIFYKTLIVICVLIFTRRQKDDLEKVAIFYAGAKERLSSEKTTNATMRFRAKERLGSDVGFTSRSLLLPKEV